MKILPYIIGIRLLIVGFVFTSCHKDLDTGDDLSKHDKEFIRTLGLLDIDETIILFDSQGGGFNGLMTSGNFITEKRIASYWVDDRDTTKNSFNYAFYTDIDTIWRYPKFKSLTLASFLEVHRRNGTKFKVYVSADSTRTWDFFNTALKEWAKKNAR